MRGAAYDAVHANKAIVFATTVNEIGHGSPLCEA